MLPPEEFTLAGIRSAVLIRSSSLWKQYRTVLLFLSINSEIDSIPLLQAAIEDGKKVFVPRVEDKRLIFCRMESAPENKGAVQEEYLTTEFHGGNERFLTKTPCCSVTSVVNSFLSVPPPLRIGAFGIREPLPSSPALTSADFPALIFTPGLAFDRKGNRLGRGGGFYDRFFSELDKEGYEYLAAGLCLESQRVDFVPTDEWDRPVKFLVTDEHLFEIKQV